MEQLTKEQTIAFYNSKEWEHWNDEQIVRFQLFQDKLAIPFARFHQAIEKVLGRAVWTHEFAFGNLIMEEYLGTRQAPTFEEIINLIPEENRLIIGVS